MFINSFFLLYFFLFKERPSNGCKSELHSYWSSCQLYRKLHFSRGRILQVRNMSTAQLNSLTLSTRTMSFQTALEKAFITIFTRKTWQRRKKHRKRGERRSGVKFLSSLSLPGFRKIIIANKMKISRFPNRQ